MNYFVDLFVGINGIKYLSIETFIVIVIVIVIAKLNIIYFKYGNLLN